MKINLEHRGLMVAAVAFLLTASPAFPQDDTEQAPKPMKQENSTPGLQQTPDGQTMKTVGEKTKLRQETLAEPVVTGGSTGPTFPQRTHGK